MDIITPIKEPAAIFLITNADTPFSFKNRECSNMGLDITPPGKPTNAVGIALIKLSVTIADIKNVRTAMGGVPAKTTARVIGIKTDVSSVPGMKPINVYMQIADRAANIIWIIAIILIIDVYPLFDLSVITMRLGLIKWADITNPKTAPARPKNSCFTLPLDGARK